jgi:hypothetical protein
MRNRRLAVLTGIFALGLAGQYNPNRPLTEGEILFARARRTVLASLAHQPNFTCLETINRSRRRFIGGTFRPLDSVRLEVALVNGKELYSWPGASKFEERSIYEMVGGGVETGDFAVHARNLFFANVGRFDYLGRESLNGRPAHKFHFQVPIDRSPYVIRVGAAEAPVGYQGHTWHDAENFELLRIELDFDDIPPVLPLAAGHKTIDYARVEIAGTLFTLPAATEVTTSQTDGSADHSKLTFSACRQFTGESTLIFDDPPPASASPKQQDVTLPAGVDLRLRLLETLHAATARVGQPSVWELVEDATLDGRVLLARGTRLELTVKRFTCDSRPTAFCFVELLPLRFTADLIRPRWRETLRIDFQRYGPAVNEALTRLYAPRPVPDGMLLRNTRDRLPGGYLATWRTAPAK